MTSPLLGDRNEIVGGKYARRYWPLGQRPRTECTASAALAFSQAEIHAGIFAGLENGTLRPVVGKELPLKEAARAHKEILEPGSAGKTVLVC